MRTNLYVMGAGSFKVNDQFMKIGITTRDVVERMRKLQTGCPFKITPLAFCSLNTEDAVRLEKHIHSRLAKFKINGEWFLMNDESEQLTKDILVEISIKHEVPLLGWPERKKGILINP